MTREMETMVDHRRAHFPYKEYTRIYAAGILESPGTSGNQNYRGVTWRGRGRRSEIRREFIISTRLALPISGGIHTR